MGNRGRVSGRGSQVSSNERRNELSGSISSHRDLVVRQRAVDLGIAVHRLTRQFPADERFGMTSQMRRSAVSIASNIAEGYVRGSRTEYLRFLRIARGSLLETETQLVIADRLDLGTGAGRDEIRSLLAACARLLSGLLKEPRAAGA